MPVIVIGADSPLGRLTVEHLAGVVGELRAFVTDPDEAATLKARGVKVAIGDVSDGSHVGGAATDAFCAVLIPEAAIDERERSFAADPGSVISAWMAGLADAGVQRAIWLEHDALPDGPPESPSVAVGRVPTAGRPTEAIAGDIARLEAAAQW